MDLRLVTVVVQVWANDTTFIPLQKVFVFLVAIAHLFSRNVLIWKFSNSLDTEFCLEAMGMPLERGRKTEIFYSAQVCQFIFSDFGARQQAKKITIICSGRKDCYHSNLV